MVTIIEKTAMDSVITSATIEVSNARNSQHALHLAIHDLEQHGWTVDIEQYEASTNIDGSYNLSLY